MANLITRQVSLSWASGRHRHQMGGVFDVYPPQNGTLNMNDDYPPAPPAASVSWTDAMMVKHHADFVLMTVSGGTNGAIIYTPADLAANKNVPHATVGSADIVVVSMYIESGGPGGPGSNAVCVDAFDITTGQFIDPDFVSVTVNGVPNAALSTQVNFDGVVASANVTNEHVIAFSNIGNQAFDKWQMLSPDPNATSEPINQRDMTIVPNTNGYYLALYNIPDPISIPRLNGNWAIWQWVSYATMVDGNPHFPMGPELTQFASGIAMAVTAQYSSPKLQKQIIELAAKQVGLAAQEIQKKMIEGAKEVGQ